jgi:hypothetical protein
MIRKYKIDLPEGEGRMDTGAVQFNDDWPGVFIRGDNAFHYALTLEALFVRVAGDPDPINDMVVRGLIALLKSSNVNHQRKPETPPIMGLSGTGSDDDFNAGYS